VERVQPAQLAVLAPGLPGVSLPTRLAARRGARADVRLARQTGRLRQPRVWAPSTRCWCNRS